MKIVYECSECQTQEKVDLEWDLDTDEYLDPETNEVLSKGDHPEFECRYPECSGTLTDNCTKGHSKGKSVTNKTLRQQRKFAEEGMNKTQAEAFYKEAQEASKERMKTGKEVYKRVDFNYENLEKSGQVKRLSGSEANLKLDQQSRISKEMYNHGRLKVKK